MSVTRLSKFDPAAPARLAARDFAMAPAPAPIAPAAPPPDPHAVLFRNACARLVGEGAAVERRLRAEAAETTRRIIEAIAPTLLASGARASLEELLHAFSKSAGDPVAIRAGAATIERLEKSGGQARFTIDDAMAPGDFEASWPHGAMSRDANALIQALLAALAEEGEDHG